MDLLFPELILTVAATADQKWIPVNLDEAYRKRSGPPLDMTNPDDQQRLVKEVSGDKLSYGGFLEDRSAIWKGFESGRHLGVDFNNLQPGEAVGSLVTGTVTHVIKDDTKQNGWGTRVIVLTDVDTYLLYGHLTNPRVAVGDKVVPIQILGEIAPPETNGGWFPHLHLQYMDKRLLKVPPDHVNLGYEDKENQGAGMMDPLDLIKSWEWIWPKFRLFDPMSHIFHPGEIVAAPVESDSQKIRRLLHEIEELKETHQRIDCGKDGISWARGPFAKSLNLIDARVERINKELQELIHPSPIKKNK